MPPRPSEQTEFLRVRWSTYLEGLLGSGAASRASIADALDLPTSRLSQWLAGERGVEPATAFEAGETLRERFGLDTSGPDALFAAGHFTDLFRLLRATAFTDARDAGELAVALYCRIPGRFLADELRALALYPTAIERYREDKLEAHEAARLRRDGALAASHAIANAEREGEAAKLVATPFARQAVAHAWQQAQRPLDLPNVPRLMPMPAAAPPGAAGAARSFVAGVASVASAPPVPEPAPLGPPPPDAIAVLIEAIIALARALDRRNPSTTAPRLWRMLPEWAFSVDATAFERFAGLLPSAYAHFSLER